MMEAFSPLSVEQLLDYLENGTIAIERKVFPIFNPAAVLWTFLRFTDIVGTLISTNLIKKVLRISKIKIYS